MITESVFYVDPAETNRTHELWLINKGTMDRYINFLKEELEAPVPNLGRVSSVARSVARLAETYSSYQKLNPGD